MTKVQQNELKIQVKIKPNSRVESIEQGEDGVYLVRVNAPPVEGKANARLIELLAKHFKVPKSRIEIIQGSKSRLKTVTIQRLGPLN